jgi:hypothetical protein
MATANARLRVLSHFSKVFARLTRLQQVLMAAPKDKIDGELDICTGQPRAGRSGTFPAAIYEFIQDPWR